MIQRQIINSNTFQKDLSSIIEDIEKGLAGKSGGIKLDPDYQRVYQYGVEQASKLIESLVIGIPIPTIYLATDTSNSVTLYNVIDGQHRLRSIYNFIKGSFSLKGIEKTKDLNGKKFTDLDSSLQNILLYQTFLNFVNIHVQNNPDIEIEIFDRYNANSKPLTRQEIRNAVYKGPFLEDVKSFINVQKEDESFVKSFNISKRRLLDASVLENLLVGMSIIVDGYDKTLSDSPKYAEKIMKKFSKNYTDEKKSVVAGSLEMLRLFIEEYQGDYPFSKEILDEEHSNYKFQIPSFMIFSLVLNKYTIDTFEFEEVRQLYKMSLKHHNDIMAIRKTSSTNPKVIKEVKEYMEYCYATKLS